MIGPRTCAGRTHEDHTHSLMGLGLFPAACQPLFELHGSSFQLVAVVLEVLDLVVGDGCHRCR